RSSPVGSLEPGPGDDARRTLREPPALLVIREGLGVDEDEEHPADLVAAIRPGVIRAALDQDVAGTHQRLVLVQHGPDLAFEADRVVDRIGRVEARMPRGAVGRGLAAATP